MALNCLMKEIFKIRPKARKMILHFKIAHYPLATDMKI